jgi:hypothetical protein
MYFPDDDEASWRGLGQEFLDHESRFIRTKMQSPKLGAELHAQLNRHLVERMAHFRQLMSTKKVRAHTHTHTHTHETKEISTTMRSFPLPSCVAEGGGGSTYECPARWPSIRRVDAGGGGGISLGVWSSEANECRCERTEWQRCGGAAKSAGGVRF